MPCALSKCCEIYISALAQCAPLVVLLRPRKDIDFHLGEDIKTGSDAIATYLEDHLAGAMQAVQLLKSLHEHFARESLGTFAAEMLAEVEADRQVAEAVFRSTDGDGVSAQPKAVETDG